MRSRLTLTLIALTALIAPMQGCKVYSFTGASIAPEVKSMTIAFFPSYAPLAPANVPQTFTEGLREYFINRTNLDLVNSNGHIRFEGFISDYSTRPVAITGNETAAQNRLSVTVSVTFTDTKTQTNSFEKTFTRFADYDSRQNLTNVEQQLIPEILEQIYQDIFNESLVNW
jgi:hypothetical protein